MVDTLLLYISAAPDLERERAVLARAVVEIPVPMAWRILQSPTQGEPVELESVTRADLHLLLLGGDIRAPIGLEWRTARLHRRSPVLFLKQGIPRTPAAQDFAHYLGEQAAWHPFKDSADLRRQALERMAGHILAQASYYTLSSPELERLQTWLDELMSQGSQPVDETRGETGASSVIFSAERYTPSQGVLIQPPEEKKDEAEE